MLVEVIPATRQYVMPMMGTEARVDSAGGWTAKRSWLKLITMLAMSSTFLNAKLATLFAPLASGPTFGEPGNQSERTG